MVECDSCIVIDWILEECACQSSGDPNDVRNPNVNDLLHVLIHLAWADWFSLVLGDM